MSRYERKKSVWMIAWKEKRRQFECSGYCNPSLANSHWIAFLKWSSNHCSRDFTGAGLVSGIGGREVGRLCRQNARSWIRSQARFRELRRDAEIPFTVILQLA
jgi:hypothetical protein